MAQRREVKEGFCLRTRDMNPAQLGRLVVYPTRMQFVLGFDGGGTKTDAVLMDGAGKVLARSQAGPSNPLRVGFGAAIGAVREAAREAMKQVPLQEGEPAAAICVGLAGVGPSESRQKVEALLAAEFPHSRLQICTDLDLALAAAGEGPAIVLLAGTGSFAVGRNAAGETARSGGYGSQIGDEGSAYDIGRRAVLSAMHEKDRTAADSPLGKRLLRELACADWSAVKVRAQAASDEVFPRLFSVVAALADTDDATAQELLHSAAFDLAGIAENLVDRLAMRETRFLLAKTGGMMGRSKFLESRLDERLQSLFPEATLGSLRMTPAEAAARLALKMLAPT